MIYPIHISSLWWRLLVGMLLVIVLFGGGYATAQEPTSYAGIVIHPGDGTVTYAYVPLDEPVSGIELLHRSGISLLTIAFGGLGEGVCRIEQTGCDVGSCRTRMCQTGDRNSPYWRYFQRDESGRWVAAPMGGSATKIEPGEIDGWSWTPDEGNLPDVAIADIPALAGTGSNPDAAHFARYDVNGTLLKNDDPGARSSNRSYLLVALVLAGVAVFALTLRLRPRSAP